MKEREISRLVCASKSTVNQSFLCRVVQFQWLTRHLVHLLLCNTILTLRLAIQGKHTKIRKKKLKLKLNFFLIKYKFLSIVFKLISHFSIFFIFFYFYILQHTFCIVQQEVIILHNYNTLYQFWKENWKVS